MKCFFCGSKEKLKAVTIDHGGVISDGHVCPDCEYFCDGNIIKKCFIRATCEICGREMDCKKYKGRIYCEHCLNGIKHAEKIFNKK